MTNSTMLHLQDMRRGGGGGGDPIAKPIAIMMVFMAILSSGAHLTGQNQISAALLTGILFGWARLDSVTYSMGENGQELAVLLSPEMIHTLVELGNNLVLFFAGLSVDVTILNVYWKQIAVVGSSYSVFATAMFGLLGWASGMCVGIGSITFFGVCCSLSSKQLMVDHLERHNQHKTLHSKILQVISTWRPEMTTH